MLVIMINRVNNEQIKKMDLGIIPSEKDIVIVDNEKYVVMNRVLNTDEHIPEICLEKGVWYIYCTKQRSER